MQKIPLSNSPNHTFSVTLSVNGSNAVFEFFLSYNEVGEYWTLRITDASTGTVLLDSIPLLTDEYPNANFLSQYAYLRIGNAYIVRAAPADTDFPDDTNLGSLFFLVWGDNTEHYEASSVAEAVAIIESLRAAGSAYGIVTVKGDTGATGVSIKGDQGDQGDQGIQGIQGPSGTLPIATAGGTADVITATYDPTIALTDMMLCALVASAANATTTPTFSPNGLTAHVITKEGGDPLAVGDIPGALAVCVLEYNLANTRWELLNPSVEYSTAVEILTGTEAAKAIAPDQLRLAMVGDVKAVAYETVPTGWLECNGASLLRASYAELFTSIGTNFGTADGTHFNIPDLRGKFLRGWDHAAGNDPDAAGRTAQATGGQTGDHVGTVQTDAFKAHVHSGMNNFVGGDIAYGAADFGVVGDTGSTGGNETRPINVNVMYVIKY
ncbi:MAG: phage tail protein [Gammaproteobacteria bacterium]|nr:phage tail protein [Gammaproteobacteria bacterium]